MQVRKMAAATPVSWMVVLLFASAPGVSAGSDEAERMVRFTKRSVFRLDPEAPKSKQYGAYRDRWWRSRPHMPTMRAPYRCRLDPSGGEDVFQATLKLVAQIDHGLPARVWPPRLAQRCHQLREPRLASLSGWHQVLARRSLLSGERFG